MCSMIFMSNKNLQEFKKSFENYFFLLTGFKKGFCQSESRKDVYKGGYDSKTMSSKNCRDFCMTKPLATACEFKKKKKVTEINCIAHTYSVGPLTDKNGDGLCSLILPKG